MSPAADRLYALLPLVHRERDEAQGQPLRALLAVIEEQADVVEADILQLYQDWFIETCDDWVVPYLGQLVGYQPVPEAGRPGDPNEPAGRALNRALLPRQAVANAVRYRRRKGTLALLELLARDVGGWPARAVEMRRLMATTQPMNHLRLARGRSVDLRRMDALDRLDGPFDELAHRPEMRRLDASRPHGRYGLPTVAVFLWRLGAWPVTEAPAHCVDRTSHCFTFNLLGNDTPLFTRPRPEVDPAAVAGELDVPAPIRRRALAADLEAARQPGGESAFYGPGKSFAIWRVQAKKQGAVTRAEPVLVPAEELVVADLSGWVYRPRPGQVAVDPVLGRIAFPARSAPQRGVRVSYHYGFPAAIGGGEYLRPLRQAQGAKVYPVGEGQKLRRLGEALERWRKEPPCDAVIEIVDNGVYSEPIAIEIPAGRSLTLRAAQHKRPLVRLLDFRADAPDHLAVHGEPGSAFTLDGLLVAGRGVAASGHLDLAIRHSTLVPGWDLDPQCHPTDPEEPSLVLYDLVGSLTVDHSIVGTIQVNRDEVRLDPLPITVEDSIVDATSAELEAVGAQSWPRAHAVLTVRRSTVFGKVMVHAIELAENSLFDGEVCVGRQQIGCMRFCWTGPGSHTPKRYHCQPDLAVAKALEGLTDPAERIAVKKRTTARVRPRFESRRYGTPTYARLTRGTATEIRRGAEDESEMGVYHDLYEPQREAHLRARLHEHTPAGTDAGLIFAS
ncbi:MAG TPA: hypothetical protein VF017_06625 [Thermoanaerobaculia bacterium]|nr:hypothetical protein [Thermoanaerobaculia bacterium]